MLISDSLAHSQTSATDVRVTMCYVECSLPPSLCVLLVC